MKFVVDQQLPPALVQWFEAKDQVAEHVRNIGLRDADDREIWQWAEKAGAIIVTKDGDFAFLKAAAGSGPVILWLRVGNVTTDALLSWLNERWSEIETALAADQSIIEVR